MDWFCYASCWHGTQFFHQGKYYSFPSENYLPRDENGVIVHFEPTPITGTKREKSKAIRMLKAELRVIEELENPTPRTRAEIQRRQTKISAIIGEATIDPRDRAEARIKPPEENPPEVQKTMGVPTTQSTTSAEPKAEVPVVESKPVNEVPTEPKIEESEGPPVNRSEPESEEPTGSLVTEVVEPKVEEPAESPQEEKGTDEPTGKPGEVPEADQGPKVESDEKTTTQDDEFLHKE